METVEFRVAACCLWLFPLSLATFRVAWFPSPFLLLSLVWVLLSRSVRVALLVLDGSGLASGSGFGS